MEVIGLLRAATSKDATFRPSGSFKRLDRREHMREFLVSTVDADAHNQTLASAYRIMTEDKLLCWGLPTGSEKTPVRPLYFLFHRRFRLTYRHRLNFPTSMTTSAISGVSTSSPK
jgi:hypothetical protein